MQEEIIPSDVEQVVETTPSPEAPTLDSIKADLSAAIASGNDAEVMRLSKLVLKSKSDVEKAEAERLKVEAEAMAGDRMKLSQKILKSIRGAYDEELAGVKAKGFTFNLPNETSDIPTVALLVPAIRKTGGGGGGSTGALKQQTGLSRHEIIDQYATTEEKATIQEAFNGATSRPDSARYSAEKPVIKRILDENRHLIKK